MIPRDQVRVCPGCREERHITHFILDSPYCAVCRENGPLHPIEEGKAMSKKGERAECPWCHGMKSNLWEHKKRCKQRPADTGSETGGGGTKATVKKRGRRKKVRASPSPRRPLAPSDSCGECPYRGLDTAQAQDLVARCVRGGMAILPACEIIRDVLAAKG